MKIAGEPTPQLMPMCWGDKLRDGSLAEQGEALRGYPGTPLPRQMPDGLCDFPTLTEGVGGRGKASSPVSDFQGQCSYFSISSCDG